MAVECDVAVLGGGVIGMAIAWRCLQRGLLVTVVDPAPGSGATRTAAGMLAPVGELRYGEQALLALTVESASRYPGFVAELQDCTGQQVGFRRTGSVIAAWDGADLAGLHDLHDFACTLGQSSQLLTGRELRHLEPALTAGLPGGLLIADDHQVDNRRLHRALVTAVLEAGGRLVRRRAVGLHQNADRVDGVRTDDGSMVHAVHTVVAAGAWSGSFSAADLPIPVRPVKGQTLRLRIDDPGAVRHVVRGSVKGSAVYVVPRSDGRLVVGASSEEAGFDVRPRAGAVYELLRDAQSLLPLLGEAVLEETSTALRPGSPDNAPIIGRSNRDGLLLATGHYRNGILLAPVTADAIAELVHDGTVAALVRDFGPSRFAPIGVAACGSR